MPTDFNSDPPEIIYKWDIKGSSLDQTRAVSLMATPSWTYTDLL